MASPRPTVSLRRLSVKYVGSGEEFSQIVHTDELTTKKIKKSVQTFRAKDEEEYEAAVGDEDETEEKEEEQAEEEEAVTSSSLALLGDSEVDGGQVYSFRTPKRSNRAAEMAARSIQKTEGETDIEMSGKVTRSSRKGKTHVVAKVNQSRKRENNVNATSDVRNSGTAKDCKQHKNDQNGEKNDQGKSNRKSSRLAGVRRRYQADNRKSSRLAGVRRRYQADDSSEASVDSSSSDEEEDSESIASEASDLSEHTVTRRSGRSRITQATNEDLEASSENYFQAHSGGVVTSDHTLSRLAKPKMDQKELDNILKTAKNSNNEEKVSLFDEHTQLFHKWMVQLSNGFNLLLYGLGSKRHLIESFRSTHLSNYHHIVINGFFPSLTIRQILVAIIEDVLESKRTARSLQEQFELIKSELENRVDPVFLILHNLDGPLLRITKHQNLLSSLAQISCIHVIASIDHINAPLIWDQGRFCCFNWLWYDVTSYQDYTEETSYENSLLVRQSGALTLSSISHVLKSVPPNVQGVFNILVEAQLEHKDDISYSGMTFQDLYQRSREAFYVSSDLTLRAQLTEFKDHKLLTFKKGIDGAELLSIPVESSTLKEFKQQEDL